MTKTFYRTILLVAAVSFCGIFSSVKAQNVSGFIANGSVTRGTPAQATVVLSVPGGLHVNSNRPSSEYAIPTTVRATARGVKIGRISYPRGKNRKFDFSENAINVYDGSTTFRFNITVPQTFAAKTVAVRVVVNYQACTNEVCYPPKSKEFTMRANVR
jgi:thiol:disulfide interchange protein